MEGVYDSDLELKYADQIAGLLSTPSPQAVEKYYDKLALAGHGHGLKVKQTKEMGKGVFAERDFREDELVLQDRMLVGAQHFANKGNSFVCSFCFCYIGSIEIQIGRQLFLRSVHMENGDGLHNHNHSLHLPENKSKMTSPIPKEVVEDLLNGKLCLPFSDHFPLPAITKCIGGCSDESYCSTSCAEAAWEAFHSLLCTGERSLCKNRAGLLDFKQHADETNDIFHVAAQVICTVILKGRKAKENLHEGLNFSEVLTIWEPFSMGYKKLWWECVALPEDIYPVEESEFRKEMKELAWTSLQLLKGAIFEEEYAPRLASFFVFYNSLSEVFSLQVYGNIIGMFELNNLDLVVASPVEDYFIYIDDLPRSEKIEAEKITVPLLEALGDGYATNCEGTAFFPLQSCINHSCEPNCKAFKREQVRGMILDEHWWARVQFILDFTEPIMTMLRFADIDAPCLGDVYDGMDTMVEKVNFFIQEHETNPTKCEALCKKVEEIIYHLWEKMTTPLHFLAYVLSSRYYSQEILVMLDRVTPYADEEVVTTWYTTFSRLLLDDEMHKKNWNTYSYIHLVKCNWLGSKKAEDLVYIHTNLCLLSHKEDGYKEVSTKLWDVALECANLDVTLQDLTVIPNDDVDNIIAHASSTIGTMFGSNVLASVVAKGDDENVDFF